MAILQEQIVIALRNGLENSPFVYAFWLEGSWATGAMDEYSDLDLWFDVEDGKEDEILTAIEVIFSKLSSVDYSYQPEKPHPQILYKIFHIADTPEFLLLDVNIQSHSRKFEFTKGLRGEEVKIIFDKAEVIQFKDFDENDFRKSRENTAFHLKKMFALQSRVKAMAKRNEFIDAFRYYNKYILEPLTELLRMKYAPNKPIFVKYISKDLPQETLTELENLYKVQSAEDILSKIDLAILLFQKEI